MFKNVKCRQWWKAAGVRAVRTMAQTAVATIGASTLITEIDWLAVGSATLMAGVLSLLTSISGLPECSEEVGMEILLKESEGEINGENFFDEAEEIEGGEENA